MRNELYQVLVNKHQGIASRYHKMHDSSTGMLKIVSWVYLLWLNFAYYVLFCRFLGNVPQMELYEKKRLNIKLSESEAYQRNREYISVDDLIEKIKDYDVISFDIFDTLIFRPMSLPTDVFYLVAEHFDMLDFKNVRTFAEWDARMQCNRKNGHMEIDLQQIWEHLAKETGLDAEEGMRVECEIEKALCYANPFMLEVWNRLQEMGKTMIIVSDMYLPKSCIEEILKYAGYTGAGRIYISNEYGESKADGRLYRRVIRDLYKIDTDDKVKSGNHIAGKRAAINDNPNGFSIVHIGDNPHSDQNMARRYGLDVLPYQNVNKKVLLYRSMDMSYLIGSAYRGLVSNHLYNGLHTYSLDYEYGYLYGGLFVVGYCHFIHQYYETHQLDKVLFLSRDGDILRQVYHKMYPDDVTEYVYWSRKAAIKLMADEDRHDYFRRFIYHKINQKTPIADVLHAMELDLLIQELPDWKDIWEDREQARQRDREQLAYKQLEKVRLNPRKKLQMKQKREQQFSEENLKRERNRSFVALRPQDYLTDKNAYLLNRFIQAKWDLVIEQYAQQQTAAKKYYAQILHGCKKAAAVDVGWAGSGAMALSHLTEKVWELDCQITGIIAGTNTIHNAESDAAEPFLQDGRLVSYLYSAQMNRDLLKKHDPNKDYNVFWELLLSSPTPSFRGFYDGRREMEQESVYLDLLDITLVFGKYDYNQDGIREIQKGILDFADQYVEHFEKFPYMFRISGRDAYAPMLVAASHNERYLKMIGKRYDLEIGVN